jgi:hypothetical protein
MFHKHRWMLGGGVVAASLGALLLVAGQGTFAADHLDPPSRTDPEVDRTPDPAADIADVYAWHDGTNAYFAVTFAGPTAANVEATYDPRVLYTLNISRAAFGTAPQADIPIRWRFGPGTSGTAGPRNFGISIENLPGVTGALQGPVETVLSRNVGTGTVQAYAGLRDDPFFFDLQGFRQTVATGALSFSNTRNFFAGKNDTAVVLQIPISLLGTRRVQVWSTTARLGGQL